MGERREEGEKGVNEIGDSGIRREQRLSECTLCIAVTLRMTEVFYTPFKYLK